jgi:hypothetical protein
MVRSTILLFFVHFGTVIEYSHSEVYGSFTVCTSNRHVSLHVVSYNGHIYYGTTCIYYFYYVVCKSSLRS